MVENEFEIGEVVEICLKGKPTLGYVCSRPEPIFPEGYFYSVVAYSGNPFTKSGRGPLLCRPENIKTVCLCVNYAETSLLAQ